MGTYQNAVSAYIVLTEFARQKFISGGLPARKLFVKPNCLFTDPGPGAGVGDFVLFAGRLSPEKGVATLLAAWKLLDGIRLTIAGDGPLAPIVAAEAARNPKNIEWLGRVGPERVRELMGEARCVVFPSECYEGLPFAIVEAFSRGTPVIASGQGSMPWLIDSGTNGLLFEPRSPADLAAKVQAVYRDHARIPVMRTRARQEFEAKYTAEANCRRMIEIYDYVLREQSQPSSFDGPEDRDFSPPSGFAGQAAGNCASKAEE